MVAGLPKGTDARSSATIEERVISLRSDEERERYDQRASAEPPNAQAGFTLVTEKEPYPGGPDKDFHLALE